MGAPKPVMLMILDGWGHRDDPTDNALAQARLPNWRRLVADCPNTLIHTSGLRVGLPEGQMGNSEVGHMNLGAGRVVYQELTRIDRDIEEGRFSENPALVGACDAARDGGRVLHVLGLLSPGGVHSHEAHIHALLRMAVERGVERVAVHALLDGRDMPPRSARPSIEALQALCDRHPQLQVASVGGRYYGMDRDKRWDRVQRAWSAIVHGGSDLRADSALAALDAAYARGENDEFVAPTVIGGGVPIEDGDAVVFMNFRADRARQLTACLSQDGFDGFDRGHRPRLSKLVTLTEYAADLPVEVAYPPSTLDDTLPEVVARAGLTQLRIAETEKYAHVTFFFSGGVEQVYPGEERILVPSPKVATYDLQPEMSCPEVTDRLVEAIRSKRFDLIVCNIANPDMVGHTGVLEAAIAAAEAVDMALGRVREAIEAVGGALLITADHGNLEMMRDPETGQPHTQHTTGPVPLVYVGPREASLRGGGALCDIAPTLLDLLGLPVPAAMSGRSLLAA
ncbi:2,3-bisphosphoglycerate-independent phosphoglycerate mutase [Pseudomarimonas salicorniae]|uniref:2,3-bisphosphoglycerate-independent phosphoglycerate mutase n=1 Tax=Pseudomarimonas salicorniae TaxID=2933270 RepID=UPI003CCE0BD2